MIRQFTIRFVKRMIGIRFDSLILGIRFELRDLTAKSSVDLVVYLFHSCVELAFSTGLPTCLLYTSDAADE